MPRSIRLRELQNKIGELRERALPRTFEPTGTYSDRVIDRTRGFRLLAHAEIEACLEDLGIDTVNTAYSAWTEDGRPRTTLVSLLSFGSKKFDTPESLESTLTLRERMNEIRNEYVNWVRNQNHGVREKNVLRILLPAGIREHEIDTTWLATIDSFGSARGSTAHNAGRPLNPPDPARELQTVRQIVKGLEPIDRRLTELRSE